LSWTSKTRDWLRIRRKCLPEFGGEPGLVMILKKIPNDTGNAMLKMLGGKRWEKRNSAKCCL